MPKNTVIDLPKVLAKINKLGVEGRKGVDQITEAVIGEIALDARQRAPINMGKLQQSIVPINVAPFTYRVVVGENYAPYVEFGTGAKVQVPSEFAQMASQFKSRRGSFDEGLQSIKDWCKSKGIEENAAYPIFISILKNGIQPQPFLYPAFVKGRSQYLRDLKQLLKELTQ